MTAFCGIVCWYLSRDISIYWLSSCSGRYCASCAAWLVRDSEPKIRESKTTYEAVHDTVNYRINACWAMGRVVFDVRSRPNSMQPLLEWIKLEYVGKAQEVSRYQQAYHHCDTTTAS